VSEHNLPLVQSYRPRSFRERGIVAPFTTPMLQGARIRRVSPTSSITGERALLGPTGPSEPAATAERLRDSALEVIVPNPSGGRGVYILPWSDIGALCRPTLHDAMLGRSLSTPLDGIERNLSPARLRDAARAIAIQGLAGRAAAAGATAAIQRQAEGLVATRFTLLMKVTEQLEARRTIAPALVHQPPSEIERRGGVALIQLANELGQKPQRMSDLLDMLAVHFVDVGCGLGMADASLPSLVAHLGVLRNQLAVWAQGDQTSALHDNGSAARGAVAVTGAAELAARMARMALEKARARLTDMPGLLRASLADPADISRCCEQPSWLLDGWEQIWLIWRASPALLSQHDAISAICRQIPLLPDEAEAWLGLPQGTAEQLFRRAPQEQPWHKETSSTLDLIARNEHLRAMAG
jgi:hypothetical protein